MSKFLPETLKDVSLVCYDKNADIGGTWFENTYPGCRVDNANHMYSYSFEPNHFWPQHFSPQPVLLKRRCHSPFVVADAKPAVLFLIPPHPLPGRTRRASALRVQRTVTPGASAVAPAERSCRLAP